MITKDTKPVVTIFKPSLEERAQKIEISSACYCGIAKVQPNIHLFATLPDKARKSKQISAKAVCNIPVGALVIIEKFGVPFAPSRSGYLVPTKYAVIIGKLVDFIYKTV